MNIVDYTDTSDMDSSKDSNVPQRGIVITGLVVTDLPLIDGKPPKKTLMKVEAGKQTVKTEDFNAASQSPKWSINILIDDLESINSIRFSLYRRRHVHAKALLAEIDIAVDKFLPSNKELRGSFLVAPSQKPSTLVVHYQTNIKNVASDLLTSSAAPTEGFDPSDLSTGKDVADGIEQVAAAFSFLDSMQPFKEMFDRLAKVHPMASAVWSLLTVGLDIMEAQYAKDKGIVELHKAMVHTFGLASQKDIVEEWDILESTFNAMIRQTIECHIFISGYASKGYLREYYTISLDENENENEEFTSRNPPCPSGRLTMLDITQKTAEFLQGFKDLDADFSEKLHRGVAVVTIGTHEAVKFMEREMILNKLKPRDQLKPRNKCLLGTRIEPISKIIAWIANMNEEVMVLTGLPGTGKSTLMSSIADAARRMGARSRLGAYIRFDRKLLNDASNVITTIAYKLASFDKRIAQAISAAIEENQDFEDMSMQEQFKILLLDPLRAVKALEEEGPIVVLIDALDECEASEARTALIEVLANGFSARHATLPFMRLIVASRPLPNITNVFNSQTNARIHTYSLDNMAEATVDDIRLYFTERFRQLGRENDDFKTLCGQRDAIQELTKRACGLFIWASVTCTFIKEYPLRRLPMMLDSNSPTEPEAALDAIYRVALNAALDGSGLNNDIKADMKTVLGAILVMENPPGLVPSVIDGLLFHSSLRKLSQDILCKLACVIIVQSSRSAIRSIHTSFNDFLVDKERSGDDWHIDVARHHKQIAMFCMQTLGSHFERTESDSSTLALSATINAIIIRDVHLYACQFWIIHLCRLDPQDQDMDNYLRVFFQKHFLKWLQMMSKFKLSDRILSLMKTFLQHTNKGFCSATDRILRYDAYQFAEQYIADIQEEPSLICSTGLTFCAENSSLRTLYPRSQASPTVQGIGSYQLQALSVHRGVIRATFFPDGSKFVSASWDSTLRIWDARTGAPIFDVMKGHTNKVHCVKVSPDGLKIASGGDDNMVIIWDALTGKQLMEPFHGHNKPVSAIDFSPDSSKVVSGGDDKSIRIWDVLTRLPAMEPIFEHEEAIECVAFSPDGRRILSAADDHTIRMWDALTGAALFEPIRLEDVVLCIAFSPDGSKFVSGSTDSIVRIWDSTTASVLESIRGHNQMVTSVCFSDDGAKVVSGSLDCTIRVWNSVTSNLLAQPMQVDALAVMIQSVQFSPDNTKVLSTSSDSTNRIWDVSALQSLDTRAIPSREVFQMWNLATTQLLQSSESQHVITAVAFSPDGNTFISGGWDNAIKVWDTATSSIILGPILGHTAPITSVAYSPQQLIASGSYDSTVRLWNADTGSPFSEPFNGHSDIVNMVSFSSDGSRIVSTSDDHTIRVWDVTTGKELFDAIRGHKDIVNAARFSPDDTAIVSGSDDRTVCIWSGSSGKLLHDPLCAHTGQVTCVAWSPNGKMIASASKDSTVKLWDLARYEVIHEFRVDDAMFTSVTFWRDAQRLVITSTDGMVYARNMSTSESLFEPFQAHTGSIYSAALSPDASKILTGSFDKTLRLWDATNGASLSAPIDIYNLVTSFCCNTGVIALGAGDNTVHVWNTSTMTMPYGALAGHKGVVLSLSLDSNNSRLASASKDRTFIVWDIIQGKLLYQVDAHADTVTSVAFSPDGSKIVTGSADKTIKVWDASDGKSLLDAPMIGHLDCIVSVAFSPSGLHLVSTSLDNTLRVWEASTGALIFVTESINNPPLEKAVFSANGQSLIYACVGGAIYKLSFQASSLASLDSSSNDVKRIPLEQSEILVKFPRSSDIMVSYMTHKKYFAAIRVPNKLITVDLS